MERLSVYSTTPEDLEVLQRTIQNDPDKPTIGEVLSQLHSGALELWRHNGLLLVLEENRRTSTLYIVWLGGEGLLGSAKTLEKEMVALCKERGLSGIGASTVRKGTEKIALKFGAKTIAKRLLKEV